MVGVRSEKQYIPGSNDGFIKRICELAKKCWARRIVKAASAATMIIVISALLIITTKACHVRGAYVDPDSVSWKFYDRNNSTIISATAQKVELFGLYHRDIPVPEPIARNAVNAYLIQHKPNFRIFSMNLPGDTVAFERTISAKWVIVLVCK